VLARSAAAHKWTLRYWADSRQRERSFADELDANGRPRYGPGKRLARDAQLKIAHDKRAGVFIDPSSAVSGQDPVAPMQRDRRGRQWRQPQSQRFRVSCSCTARDAGNMITQLE